jgi:hypothetical protein
MGTIDSILSKIDNPTLGQALGFTMLEFNYDRHRGTGMFSNLMKNIGDLMTQPHFPDVSHVINDLFYGWGSEVFKPAIMAGIAGWILDEVDMNPTISRIGKVLKTLGLNGAMGVAGAVLLDRSSTGFSPGEPAGQPYGGHNGYPAGAGYSPLGRHNGGYFTMPTVPPAGTPNLPVILPRSPRPS